MGNLAQKFLTGRKKQFAFNSWSSKPSLGPQAKFAQHGEHQGAWVFRLFTNFSSVVDEVAFFESKSITDQFQSWPCATFSWQTGSPRLGRPKHRSWVTYGLGQKPKLTRICSIDFPEERLQMLVKGGSWGSGFLPSVPTKACNVAPKGRNPVLLPSKILMGWPRHEKVSQ